MRERRGGEGRERGKEGKGGTSGSVDFGIFE